MVTFGGAGGVVISVRCYTGTDTLEAREAAASAGCVAFVDKTDAVHALVPAVLRAAAFEAGSVAPE